MKAGVHPLPPLSDKFPQNLLNGLKYPRFRSHNFTCEFSPSFFLHETRHPILMHQQFSELRPKTQTNSFGPTAWFRSEYKNKRQKYSRET